MQRLLGLVGAVAVVGACSGAVRNDAPHSGAGGETAGEEPCAALTDRVCYAGPVGTRDVGLCRAGRQACEADGTGYGPCDGEVVPHAEVCATADDESCDGIGACTGDTVGVIGGGAVGEHGGADVAVDGAGNVLLTGRLVGGMEIGGASLDAADYQAFALSLERNPDGAGKPPLDRETRWALVGEASSSSGSSVATDASGNVYVAGGFYDTLAMGGATLTSAGGADVFVLALDPDGNLLWSQRFGGAHDDWVVEIAVGDASDVTVFGGFEGSTDLAGEHFAGEGAIDIFALELSSDGTPLWARAFGSAGLDYALGAAVGPDGTIALSGSFEGVIDLGGGPLTSEDEDAFVVVLDAGGAHRWSRRFGGASHDLADGIAIGGAGDIAVGGLFSESIDLGGGPMFAEGAFDAFVASFDATGAHRWSRRFGGPDAMTYFTRIGADGAGNVVGFGTFTDSITLGGVAVHAAPGSGSSTAEDLFVVKLDPGGSEAWSRTFGGPGIERPFGLAITAAGGVVLTGDFQGTVDFGAGSLSAPPESGWGLYLVELAP